MSFETETNQLLSPVLSQQERNNCLAKETKHAFGLPFLVRNISLENVPPVLYLKAAGECLFLTLVISWILTYFFNESIIYENALLSRLGYNNPCV